MPELKLKRPTWHETWMKIAYDIVKDRSYEEVFVPTRHVCALIVTADNTQTLAHGYNGNYAGGPHIPDSLEPGASNFIHAEINALIKFPYDHHKECIMYVTLSPCLMCAKAIINSRIKYVIYDQQYRDTSGIDLLRSAGVKVLSLKDAILITNEVVN